MNNIKSLRESIGLTQRELGERLGLTQGAIGNYESDARRPSLDDCRRIVSVLNAAGAVCTLDDVFPPGGEPTADDQSAA